MSGWKKLHESPKLRSGRSLRPYQLEGVNWLRLNWYLGRNVILGDEMGLGKTAQSCSLLNSLRLYEHVEGPFLIVVPLSTLPHWERELGLWTDFYVVTYHGSQDSRRTLLQHDWKLATPRMLPDAPDREGGRAKKRVYKYRFNCVITTYETVVAEPEPLYKIRWEHLIVDEGHRLKNRHSQSLNVMKDLRCRRKLVLTGTPLQNHVSELWSILFFLEPEKFADHQEFNERFGSLSSGGGTVAQVKALNKLLRPHLLRREKEDVETLQPMQEVLLHVEITNLQKVCYRAVLEHNRTLLLRGAGGSAGSVSTLAGGAWANVSMMLRHCCNHPWLIKEVEQGALEALEAHSYERAPQTHRERSDALYWWGQLTALRQAQSKRYVERLVSSSGKMVLLDKLLPKLKADGHRVLIFSQFTKVLDLLEELIEARGYGYERLDGNDRGISRQQAIDRFSDPQSESFIFLLSTRAGGIGINLTAADTVVIYDPDWNPQNDIQAMARCHRIGQTKPVKVYKIVTRDTYEMHMLSAANHKLGLEHAVMKTGGFESTRAAAASSSAADAARGPAADGPFSSDPKAKAGEIERLLKYGAQVLTAPEHDERVASFAEASIDNILEKYAETRTRPIAPSPPVTSHDPSHDLPMISL